VRIAHRLIDPIETAIQAALPGGVEVAIHIEPIEDQAAWNDSALIEMEQLRQQPP